MEPIAKPVNPNDVKTSTKKKKVRKKKPQNKKSTANTAAINSAAREQYQKLLQNRNDILHDAAWLSTDHSLPASALASAAGAGVGVGAGAGDLGGTTNATNGGTRYPYTSAPNIVSPPFLEQDVEIVNRALVNNGLTMQDVTAEAFATLLEQARRHAMLLITDAADYAVHSHGNETITSADLLLAKEMQGDDCLGQCNGENMEQLARIAKETNRRVLPPIPDHCYNGIVLPDLEYTLLGRTYDVVCRRDEQDIAKEKSMNDANGMGGDLQGRSMGGGARRDEKVPSYGAKRGAKQVQISFQSEPPKHSSNAGGSAGYAHVDGKKLPDASNMDLS